MTSAEITVNVADAKPVRALLDAVVAYRDAWLKLQDGAETVTEKQADMAAMHSARVHLFDMVDGRQVVLNRFAVDPRGWLCKCGQVHEWGVGICPTQT
jgi:hypothetical protein